MGLLAYCASERRRSHSRDSLAGLLWADAAPERSRHNLRQAIWRLRRVLGDALETKDDAIVGVHADVALDRDLFLDAVARGDLSDAFTVYTGPFLLGTSFPGGDQFEDWANSERARLEEMLVKLVDTVLHAEPTRLRPADRRTAVQMLIERAPDSLEARRLAIDVAMDADDRVAARRQAEELETLAIRLELPLTNSVRAALDRARATHVPKDATNSPLPLLALVGRDDPLEAAKRAWGRARRGDAQFIGLRGVAGVGKTRLLETIASHCQGRRTSLIVVRANPGEADIPFSFVALLARELAELRGAAGISEESASELVALDPGLANRFAARTVSWDEGERTRRRVLALVDMLSAIAEQQPLALLLDDLHWADSASRQTLTLALKRVSTLPVLVVGASRGDDAYDLLPEPRQVFELAPLSAAGLRESLVRVGAWPDEEPVTSFLDAVCDTGTGLPLELVGRLTLAIEAGLLALVDGQWASPDWRAATEVVGASAPIERQLRNCAEEERTALLILAVAGIPLGTDVLHRIGVSTQLTSGLEDKGLIQFDHDGWRPAHDAVADSVLRSCPPDTIRATHSRIAHGLDESGRSDRWSSALRHHLAADDTNAASAHFVAMLSRIRKRGDRRPAAMVLSEILGDTVTMEQRRALLDATPWYHRTPERFAGGLMVGLGLIATIAVIAAWTSWRQPALRVIQTAIVTQPAPLFGAGALRLAPSVLLRLDAQDAPDSKPRVVRVRALSEGTRLLSNDSVLSDRGLAGFGGLRFTTSDSIVRLRFESRGYRSVELDVRAQPYPIWPMETELRILGGRLRAGSRWRTLGPGTAELRAAPGALIDGVVQLHYSSALTAASVWLSMTPTWGDPAAQGRDLFPVTTPVSADVVDVPLALQAPKRSGHYWILFTVAAEPSGGFALSGTNWTMERPIWGDGNDLAQLPDSVVREASRTGTVTVMSAYPLNHRLNRAECRAVSQAVSYCPSKRALTAIALEVH